MFTPDRSLTMIKWGYVLLSTVLLFMYVIGYRFLDKIQIFYCGFIIEQTDLLTTIFVMEK